MTGFMSLALPSLEPIGGKLFAMIRKEIVILIGVFGMNMLL